MTTAKIAANAVTANEVAANAITTAKIMAGAVTVNELAANSVTAAKIVSGAVTADALAANSVTSDKIVSNSVTTAKIAAGAVTATEIAANAIAARHLMVGDFTNLVPNADISDQASWTIPSPWVLGVSGSAYKGSHWTSIDVAAGETGNSPVVVSQEFSVDTGVEYFASIQARSNGASETIYFGCNIQWLKTDGTSISFSFVRDPVTEGPITRNAATYSKSLVAPAGATRARFRWYVARTNSVGRAIVGSPEVRRKNYGKLIVDGAIVSEKIAANAVTTAKIAAGSVTANELAANSVVAGKVAAGAISTDKLAANAVNASKIAANSITSTQLATNSVTADAIAAGAVQAAAIAAGAVVADKIGAGAITTAKLAANAVTADKINVTSLSAISANIGFFQTASSGARLVISDDRIRVFDATGTLRVKIGNLA